MPRFRASQRNIPPQHSRRQFLRQLSSIGGGAALLRDPFDILGNAERLPAFEQIAPRRSGIQWIHTAGKSPQKYLPETSGAGCAFLDYDNDGWMDIYLVNSGTSDFYNPPHRLRNALYRNNRNGTFTDVTEKAGVSGGGY